MNNSNPEPKAPEGVSYKTYLLPPSDWVPNNRRLPAVVYRHAVVHATDDLARDLAALFEQNHWPPRWRDGILDHHHFHSTAHEVLGIASGSAEVILGGPDGSMVWVDAGDVLLLPAGTGHRLHSSVGELCVVGAYPAGQQCDTRREALTPDELAAMESLPFPASDPVLGDHGPVLEVWQTAV
jgi:uncharacterized protein YjlB